MSLRTCQCASGAYGHHEMTTDALAAPELLADADVERLYGIRAGTLRAWRSRGEGPPYIEVSRRMPRYRRQDLDDYLASRRVAGGGR